MQVPSPEYLLAMKLHASRDERDLDDAATLFLQLGYTTPREGAELLARTYPAAQLLPRHRYVLEDVVRRAAISRTGENGMAGPRARARDLSPDTTSPGTRATPPPIGH